MASLVDAALVMRKTTRAGYGVVAAAALLVLDVLGVFRVAAGALRVEHAIVAAVFAIVLGARLVHRARLAGGAQDGTAPVALRWLDLEIGTLVVVAVHAAVQLGGGLTGPLYPLVYVAIALCASFARKPVGTVLVVGAVGVEAVLYTVTEGHRDYQPLALHATFIVAFGLSHLVFTRAEIARVRQRGERVLAEEQARVHEDARLYRLVGTATDGTVRDDERLFRSSLDEVRQALYFTLDLLKRTMGLHSCVLLLVDERGEQMRIAECVSDSEDLADGPFAAGEGAVGAVAKRGLVTTLEHLRPGYKGLCYYRGGAVVRSFLGVPVVDHGQVRGALCADRTSDRPFDAGEQAALEGAVHQVLRALTNERVFVQLERSKREQTVLHRASQALGAALSEDAVIDAGLAAAAEIAAFDFAAVTLYDAAEKKHTVRKAVGEGAAQVTKLSFRDNTSLTAMAVKNRHYLPYRGDFDPAQHVVFTRKATFAGMQSLLILPLVVQKDAIGTLCLAAQREGAFGGALRPTLQVLGNQLAVSLANAASVRRLEELATTDGLTGCLNKRAFLDELEKKLRAAERFGRRLSLVITDIDHFKNVNDVYGHATGDVVIKELGAVLRRVKRETDVVARFGGEEFCLLCEETDQEGARLLAERVREELGGTAFQTELGQVKVTCSLGVATFPQDAGSQGGLFEIADKALYAAKHAGRNRVCTPADL